MVHEVGQLSQLLVARDEDTLISHWIATSFEQVTQQKPIEVNVHVTITGSQLQRLGQCLAISEFSLD